MSPVPDVRILVVDDEEMIRDVILRLLQRDGYECSAAGNADEALEALAADDFAMALIDMNMPGRSGLDLAGEIIEKYPDIATLMVTGLDDVATAREALRRGVHGYITKPFKPIEILTSVESALLRRSFDMDKRNEVRALEERLQARTNELADSIAAADKASEMVRSSSEETLSRLATAAEFRDDETARHVHRMSHYCALLTERTGADADRVEFVRRASMMHDVGKIGIPDGILLKPGKLTDAEKRIMERHTEIGFEILASRDSDLLDLAANIALTHHERIDGTGYPRGLTGDNIPLEGRIAAICDVFDALTSDRVYRPAFTVEQTIEMMRADAGKHFDTELLELFLSSLDEVLEIRERYSDPESATSSIARLAGALGK